MQNPGLWRAATAGPRGSSEAGAPSAGLALRLPPREGMDRHHYEMFTRLEVGSWSTWTAYAGVS